MLRFFLLIIVSLLLAACSAQGSNIKEAKETMTRDNAVSMIKNLEVPWSITKMKNTFYISERKGTIVSFNETNRKMERLIVKTNQPIHQEGESGLLGIELTPNFSESQQAYAYHTYYENDKILNRVIVIQKNKDSWNEVKVLLEEIPGSAIHNGGRVKIGSDQKLYVTIGDAAVPENAQKLNSLSGKIIRMELDGSIPKDNPFRDSYVFSFGHRNVQGLTWNEKGDMYGTEHGQSAHDEVNHIIAGHNYGWPIIEGDETREGLESPFFQTGNITWAPSGIDYKNGKIYIATLRGEAIRELNLDTSRVTTIAEDYGRLRDVLIDGENVYFISNNLDGRGSPSKHDDQLWKIDLSALQ
nr:PQQ-dependent sugar dehydrogenase [Heyndrickxia oleronia]